jgi:undecaprenyl-diphosphatase
VNSRVDAGLYRWVVDLSLRTPQPVDDVIRFFSDYGLALFAVLMLLAWWRARPADGARMAAALAVPLAVVAAFLANDGVKSLVDEQRPCRTLHTATVEACPALGDWSFPSNHTAIAFAAAAALLVAHRRLGLVALPLAVLMGLSRVWIGAHYPHDVLAGAVLGTLVGWALTALAARRAAPAVRRLRGSRLFGPALAVGGAPPVR